METSTILLLCPVAFVMAALLTQLIGHAGRPFHEGLLAWLFLPIGLIACLSALSSEGVSGMKNYLHEFFETLLNHKFQAVKHRKDDTHRVREDFA